MVLGHRHQNSITIIDLKGRPYTNTEILGIISTEAPVARDRDTGNKGNEVFVSSAF